MPSGANAHRYVSVHVCSKYLLLLRALLRVKLCSVFWTTNTTLFGGCVWVKIRGYSESRSEKHPKKHVRDVALQEKVQDLKRQKEREKENK